MRSDIPNGVRAVWCVTHVKAVRPPLTAIPVEGPVGVDVIQFTRSLTCQQSICR